MQRALDRRGLGPVAGVDEAGRGACAGPLVVAACVFGSGASRHLDGLTDSKALSHAERERLFGVITARARSSATIVIPPDEVDTLGVHRANLEGMRRAVAGLGVRPGYVLTDGFRVPGLATPSVAVIKGDLVAACVAAASVLAKVTRDRIMADLHAELPWYGFAGHKGYCTPEHSAALSRHGPSWQHRWSYANVAAAARQHEMRPPRTVSSKPGLFSGDEQARVGEEVWASEEDVVDNEQR